MNRFKIVLLGIFCLNVFNISAQNRTVKIISIDTIYNSDFDYEITVVENQKDTFPIETVIYQMKRQEHWQKIEIDSTYTLYLDCHNIIPFTCTEAGIPDCETEYRCWAFGLSGLYLMPLCEQQSILENSERSAKLKWWQRIFYRKKDYCKEEI